MTATTYVTQNAAVVAGTATVDSGESITEDIVLDSKTQLQILLPAGDSGSPLAGDQTFISFQVQAFSGGDWSEAADAAGRLLAPQAFAGGIAPVPAEVAGAYAIRIRYGTASAPLIQDAAREIQFVASSPASSVTVDPTQPLPIVAYAGVTTDHSGVIASGGTQQTAMAANSDRHYLFIQNLDASEDLWFDYTMDAVQDEGAIKLTAGQSYESPAGFVSTERVSVIATTTNHKYTAKEG